MFFQLNFLKRSSFYQQSHENNSQSPKRDLISSFSPTISNAGAGTTTTTSDTLKRTSSIKLNREKTSLSNYFSGLTNGVSGVGMGVTLNFLASSSTNTNPNHKLNGTNKKTQPVSLRNNNPNNTGTLTRNKSLYNEIPSSSSLNHHNETHNQQLSKHGGVSIENVMNGVELLLTDDAHLSKLNSSGIKLVPAHVNTTNNGIALLNRTKRSDELILVDSSAINNNNPDEIEIRQLNRANNRRSVEISDERVVTTNETSTAENNNNTTTTLANNRQRFNMMNRAPNTLLKKTKSFMLATNGGSGGESRLSNPNILDSNMDEGGEGTSYPVVVKSNNKSGLVHNPAANTHSNSNYSKNSSSYLREGGGGGVTSSNGQQQVQTAAGGAKSQLGRSNSRLSHVTRDVNDSYAYTNVQQYIEENDLMPAEKAYSIRKWIRFVNQNRDEWEKRTIELNIVDS